MIVVPSVREIMTETRYSLRPDAPAYEGLDLIVDKKLSGVPVIDAEDRLIGFLTEKDCLRIQAVSHQYNMTGSTVKDIMSAIKDSLNPEMDLLSAAMQFLSCNFGALPVIEGDRLVGSLTRQDMLEGIRSMHRKKGMATRSGKAVQQMQDNPSSIFEMQEMVGRSSRAQLASLFGGRHHKQ